MWMRITVACCAFGAALAFVPLAASGQSWQGREPTVAALPAELAVSEGDRSAIRAAILRQLAAFHAGDAPLAWSFASSKLQARFGSAETFIAMVREEYDAVFRARSIELEDLVMVEGYVTQRALVTGPDGEMLTALYLMSRRPDGSWAISGCLLVPAQPAQS